MSRPNLLLLFTDQQRADTIYALGNAVIRTPHLDRRIDFTHTESLPNHSPYNPSAA